MVKRRRRFRQSSHSDRNIAVVSRPLAHWRRLLVRPGYLLPVKSSNFIEHIPGRTGAAIFCDRSESGRISLAGSGNTKTGETLKERGDSACNLKSLYARLMYLLGKPRSRAI